ncbi:sigma-70 family RNA polymerase sigma factor [Aestuariivirga sp.]|uniref:sigma-70 family RNA polymerase sigma factor n=1 Tax=Aestuariivirga sp. TaxID=2650926 RepID=UPI00391ADE43
MTVLEEIEAAIPALRRYSHALTRDREAADDLVQDCLERALARHVTWRGDGPVRAWLFRILLNRYRDTQRLVVQRPHVVPLDTVALPSRPASQDAHMDLRDVHEAMGRLPVDQRAALLLIALEGFSLAEAASVLDLPEGTLASRIARARAALREMTGHGTPRSGRSKDVQR